MWAKICGLPSRGNVDGWYRGLRRFRVGWRGSDTGGDRKYGLGSTWGVRRLGKPRLGSESGRNPYDCKPNGACVSIEWHARVHRANLKSHERERFFPRLAGLALADARFAAAFAAASFLST